MNGFHDVLAAGRAAEAETERPVDAIVEQVRHDEEDG